MFQRRSRKLKEAQTTLQKEKSEIRSDLNGAERMVEDESKILRKMETASGINVPSLTNVSLSCLSLQKILDVASKQSSTNVDKTVDSGHSTLAGCSSQQSVKTGASFQEKDTLDSKHHGKSLESKLRTMKSIYPGYPAALSPFEREALMLGIPDENVEIRHLNKVFIRGDNVVTVNIIHEL